MHQLVILVPFETNHLTCTAQAPPDIYFVGTQSIWHQYFKMRWVTVTLLVNTIGVNWVGGEGGRGANGPQYVAYLRIVFWLLRWNWGDRREKGCMQIKDWFKPIFPLFVTWLLPKVSNTRGRFLNWTLERIWKETAQPDFVYCPGICLEENCVNLIHGSQFPQKGFEPIILRLWIRVADDCRIHRRKSLNRCCQNKWTCCGILSNRVRCSSQCENVNTVVTHSTVNWWANVSSVASTVNLIRILFVYLFIYLIY